MADRKIGVALTADVSSLQKGLSAGSAAAAQFAATTDAAMSRATGAASQLSSATQYVAKSVDGFKASAQAQSAAADRFVQDLERQVATLGKTRAEIMALQAAQLGVADRAAPLISQLNAGSTSMGKMGASAAQTAAAMRMVPAQMTDIIVSLQGGQAPMTVLLQQGGQLKDMFGGIGPAAKALGGYVMGMVNPLTLAAAAAGALYMAYRTGAAEAEEFSRTLIMTGNAVGLSNGQLQDMAKRLDGIVGTQRSASAALNEFAKSGKIGATSLEDFAASAIRWEDATGAAISDTVKQFAELGKSPLEASLKLNESINYLTASVYEQIKALEGQGKETEAAALAQKAFADAIDERTPKILAQTGSIERGWRAVKVAVAEAIDAIAGVGRAGSAEQQIQSQIVTVTALQKKVDDLRARGRPVDGDLLAGLDAARGLLDDLQREYMQTTTAAGAARKAQEEFAKALSVDTYLSGSSRMSRADQMKKDIAAEKAEYEKAVRNAQGNADQLEKIERAHQESLKTIRERYKEKGGGTRGGISVTDTETANLRGRIEAEKTFAAQLAATSGMVSKLNEGERLSLQYSEKLKLATDAKTKARLVGLKAGADELGALQRSNSAIQEMAKIREREIDAQIKETESITNKAIAIEDEIAVYGLGRAAIEAMVIARLESKRAALIEMGASEDLIDALTREIAERQRLAKAMGQKEVLDANSKAAEEAARDWERVTDQVGQSLSDAIFRGGKSGKELVEDLFRTMILRPLLQPVVQGGMNLVGQALNIPGAPGVKDTSFDFGSLLGGGNISGSISNFADVAGIKLFNAGFEKVGNALVENSAAIGKFANSAGQVFGYGKAIYDVTQGSYGSAIGTAVGTYILPGIGTAIGSALGGMVDGMFGKPEARYGGTYTFRPGEGTMRPGWAAGDAGPQAMQFADSLLSSAAGAVEHAFAAAGSDALLTAFEASFESSEKGRGGTHSGGTIVIDGHEISFGTSRKGEGYGGRNGTLEEMMRNAEIDTYQTVIQGLQAGIGEFPRIARSMLEGVDADSLGLQDAQALIQTFVQSLEQIRALSNALGSLPWVPATAATYDYAAALADATGGAEQAASLVAGFYQGYVSEAQRVADLTADVTSRFAELGMTVPQTREEMLGLVQANMALGEAGAGTTAKLLTLGDDLLTVIGAAEAAAAQAAQEAQRVAQERLGLEGQLLQLMGNTAEIRRRELAALDESNRAIQQNIWAIEDQAAATQLARQMAEQGVADAMSILAASVDREKGTLQTAFDQVAEGLNTAITASESSLQSMRTLAGSLRSALDSMLGQMDPAMDRRMAQGQIERALSTALLAGVLPDADTLQRALQVVAQPSEGLFDTFEDYQADFLKTAHDINRLNTLTGDQLSTEEQTLAALREQLDTETAQFEQEMSRYDALLDAEQGTTVAVMSVRDAVANLAAAQATRNATPAPSASGSGSSSFINDLYRDILGRNVDQPGLDYWTSQLASGAISAADLAKAIRDGARNEDKALRGFAVGTNYVPYDMPANIHQGEIIIDRRSSDILRQYGIGIQPGGGSGDAEVRALRQEVRALHGTVRTLLDEIARNTGDTAASNGAMADGRAIQSVRHQGVVTVTEAVVGT